MFRKKLGLGLVYGFSSLFTAAFIALNLTGIITLLVFFFSPLAFAEDTISQTEKANSYCLSCHRNPKLSVVKEGETISLFVDPTQYKQSIHGTNSCISCHGNLTEKHKISSEELAEQVNNSCQACHDDIANVYQKSIHGELVLSRQKGAMCYDCHGKHDIKKHEAKNSRVYRLNVPATCTTCHQGEVKEAYDYSFHGTSVKLGYEKGATCADCHGSHQILGPENPESMVSKQNEPQTCAKCHLQAQENFAKGSEHVVPQDRKNAFPLWIIWKIFIVIILIDVFKDGSIAILELIHRLINSRKRSNN